MALKDRIKADMVDAMRAKDQAKLGALRLLSAAIQRREVDERITLDDAQVTAVIEKLLKQSRESIEQYEKGGRPELAAKERAEAVYWQAYMPQPLSDAEIDALIAETIAATGASSVKDMGKVMGALKPKLAGRADMGQVGAKIKSKLGG
ncbi:MAG: GatB/YqeY domain-containing protein [Gammaproteobacteria bacterium]|nr:MAG: GatB/YqeY domain-containing protein [Gammaproteobacteria bacterium]